MKYRYLIAIIATVAMLSVSVFAIGYQYTISEGNDFTSAKYGENLDAVAKKLKAAPGEMEKITIKAEMLKNVTGPITVSLEEL